MQSVKILLLVAALIYCHTDAWAAGATSVKSKMAPAAVQHAGTAVVAVHHGPALSVTRGTLLHFDHLVDDTFFGGPVTTPLLVSIQLDDGRFATGEVSYSNKANRHRIRLIHSYSNKKGSVVERKILGFLIGEDGGLGVAGPKAKGQGNERVTIYSFATEVSAEGTPGLPPGIYNGKPLYWLAPFEENRMSPVPLIISLADNVFVVGKASFKPETGRMEIAIKAISGKDGSEDFTVLAAGYVIGADGRRGIPAIKKGTDVSLGLQDVQVVLQDVTNAN